MLLAFDIRQTARPLHSMVGLSTNPIHTLHSVVDDNGCRKILSASAVGPCLWDSDDSQSRYIVGLHCIVHFLLYCAVPRIVVVIFVVWVIFQATSVDWDGQSACMHFPRMCSSIKRCFGGFLPAQSGGIRGHHRISSVSITDPIALRWFRKIRTSCPYQEDRQQRILR